MAASPVAATVDATGISAPTFATILAWLVQQYQAIFGADVYLGNDSQDFQWISVLAQAMADCNAACIAVYNAFSPATAQGAGLSSVVKINGLMRLTAGYSTVPVTVVGQANIPIAAGQVRDPNGNIWALPANVVIPATGTITVTATCTTIGAITASAGPATIVTPTYGWQSATFAGQATPGAPVETDAALRVRQSQSTAGPSQTVFEGIVAAIKGTANVGRVAAYENNTSAADANGIPANTLCFVVEGGTSADIFQAIFSKCTPGIATYGNQSQAMTDSVGSTRTISYQTPVDADIGITLTITPATGWSVSAEPVIASAVAAYLNALPIGQTVSCLGLVVPALLGGTSYAGTYTISGITIGKNGGTQATADIALAFDEAPIGATANVSFVIA